MSDLPIFFVGGGEMGEGNKKPGQLTGFRNCL